MWECRAPTSPGHSSGAAVGVQLALDRPQTVQTLALLELSLLSVPSGEAFFQQAEPAFYAYGSGDHERAIARFMSVVGGVDWTMCRALLDERLPGAVAQAVKDADTFFGLELPALAEWAFGPEQASAIRCPVLSVLGAETQPLWVEVAAFLRSFVPDVEERVIEGVGHLLHIQRAQPVARAMADFLGRNSMTGDWPPEGADEHVCPVCSRDTGTPWVRPVECLLGEGCPSLPSPTAPRVRQSTVRLAAVRARTDDRAAPVHATGWARRHRPVRETPP
jgi:hypothetical protein